MAANASERQERNWPAGVLVLILFIAIAVVGAYCYQFGSRLSPEKTDWGTFGDYVGGILNPFVAFAALILLAYSISIQRIELRDTKQALQEQATHSRDMVYLTAVLAALDREERRVAELQRLLDTMPQPPDGVEETHRVIQMRYGANDDLKRTGTRAATWRSEIDRLLKKLNPEIEPTPM